MSEMKREENCWEFWSCPEGVKEKCPVFTSKLGHSCWVVANCFDIEGCPSAKQKYEDCSKCLWYMKKNSS